MPAYELKCVYVICFYIIVLCHVLLMLFQRSFSPY